MSVTCWAEVEEMRVRRARNECFERKPMAKDVVQEANDSAQDYLFKKSTDGIPSDLAVMKDS